MMYLNKVVELAGMAFSLMLYFWFTILLFSICLIVSLAVSHLNGYRFQPRQLLAVLPLTLSPLNLFLGVIMSVPPNSQNPVIGVSSMVIQAIFLLQILLSFWIIYIIKGYRWISVFTIALELNFGYFCLYVAAMMVTGIWL